MPARMPARISVGCLILAILAAGRCPALPRQTEASGVADPNITVAMRREDPRLNQRVTITERRISIGELLEKLSKQTGVVITAGERDGAADVSIAVFCRDTPLHEALNGLWAAVSYRDAEWQWQHTGDVGSYRYHLSQPAAARKLGARLRGWVQSRLEENAERLFQAADAGEDTKRAALKAIYGTDDIAKMCAFSPDIMWAGVKGMKEAMTPQQRRAVLRGDGPVEVAMSSLSPRVRETMLSSWRDSSAGTRFFASEGGRLVGRPAQEPSSVRFERVFYGSTPAVVPLAPQMDAPWLFGGVPLELGYRDRIRQLWMLSTDRRDDPAEHRLIRKPPTWKPDPEAPVAVTPPDPSASVEQMERYFKEAERRTRGAARAPKAATPAMRLSRRLDEVSQGASVALMARLSEDDPKSLLTEPWGQTIEEYWKQLWNLPYMVKWHDGVQVFSTDAWPMEDPPVPLWLIRILRTDAAKRPLLPLARLLQCAGMLSRDQLLRLREEFPGMEAVAKLRELLVYFNRDPRSLREALGERGVPISDALASALRVSMPASLMGRVESGEAQLLRMKVEEREAAGVWYREIHLELCSREGKSLGGISFTERAEPRPAR